MSVQDASLDDAGDVGRWQQRWPVGADRVEQWDADTLVFERRFTATGWDAEDVAAAQRAYPECEVSLSDAGDLMFVRGPVAVPSRVAIGSERVRPETSR